MRIILILIFLLTSLAAADLASDVRSVLPRQNESRWSSVPWRVDLNQARAQAQKRGKPMFCWIMDGHVLAAT